MKWLLRIITAAALLFAVLPAADVCVRAAQLQLPAEDLSEQKTRLTVALSYENEEEETVPVPGAKLEVYRVAELAVSNGRAEYVILSDYADLGLNFEGMNASESAEAAKKLKKQIRKKQIRPTASAQTNPNGLAEFENLSPGMYLGLQTKPAKVGDDRVAFEPTLWMAPQPETSKDRTYVRWEYGVTVMPKATPDVETETTPVDESGRKETTTQAGKKEPPKSPRTGDPFDMKLYLILFGLGAFSQVLGLFLHRTRNKNREK